MALGDLYGIKVHIYVYDNTTSPKTMREDYGEYYQYFPYVNGAIPTGTIWQYGLVKDLYEHVLEKCPDFNVANAFGYYTLTDREMVHPFNPNLFVLDRLENYGTTSDFVIVNTVNGRVISHVIKGGSSSRKYYETIENYVSNINPISTNTNNPFYVNGYNINGSGSTLGTCMLVFYTTVDGNGYPNNLYQITLNGLASTTNSNALQSWGAVSQYQAFFNNFLLDSAQPITPPQPSSDDPYAQGGTSTTGGGTGTFSETGDIIGIPGLPSISAVDTGFITLFNPTPAQVKQLANYMWSQNFDLSLFKNVVANPIDCILGLSIVPVDPPNAGSRAVTVGNIPTDVTLPYLSSQFVEVDCGTLNVQEFWGSYLDYSPYTKMSLYLPYIGIVPLDIDDVMNASIAIKYHVDVLSGACVAYVLCNGTQLYTYVGQCSANVPITSNDFTNTVNGILGIAGSIGSLFATGGASAPTQIGSMAGNAINALKPNIQKSGAMSGTGGMMGVQTPYLICQRPRQSLPDSQNAFTGYPANITAVLGNLSGYTEVDKIHLEGIPCTNEEMAEIMQLLESGVYI